VKDQHTAEEVLVIAGGLGAEGVHGFMPNTEIFHIIMSAQCPPSVGNSRAMNLAMRASFVSPTFCNFNPHGSGLRVYAHGIIAVHPRTGRIMGFGQRTRRTRR
jgi:hypothetical protein